MDCKIAKENFKVVGVKGRGFYANFGTEVPQLAQQFLTRKNEIQHHTNTEITLFEPKRDEEHLEGAYYVGLVVTEALTDIPAGMEYIEVDQEYATARGKISGIDKLHNMLLKWVDDQGYKQNLESPIIETYHPLENGDEEVNIYLPIQEN